MPSADRRAAAVVPARLYRAYGLVIASHLPLPELATADHATATPDVVIETGPIAELEPGAEPAGARRIGPFLWASAAQFWLRVPGIARFRVVDGREITVEADAGSDADGVRVFLLGTALGMLLTQRGNLMLHGNAIRVGNGCIVCAGRSGAGKSTLAAGFQRRGFEILTDDLVMVDERGTVTPGIPQIKLWGDMTRAMGVDTAGLRRVRAQLEKFAYPLTEGFADAPASVRALFSLELNNSDSVRIKRLTGFSKFETIRAQSYRPRLSQAPDFRARHMAQCARLAAAVPLSLLSRPEGTFSLDLLIDAILADLERA